MIFTSISIVEPSKTDGIYNTSEFISTTKFLIFQDLFNIHREHSNTFGDIVLCLDKSIGGYWRKDVYAGYKASRRKGREESEINYGEVFAEIEILIDTIRKHLPWKVVSVDRAEADDIMLVLAREYNIFEKILIHSPDKDMIQAQRNTENVFQYSALTKKWIVPENKHENMDHWIYEHVFLGDGADEVPRVIDHTIFSDNFKNHLKMHEIEECYHDVCNFKYGKKDENGNKIELSREIKEKVLTSYDIQKLNTKNEPTGELDIYHKERFGGSNLKKILDGTHYNKLILDSLNEKKKQAKADGNKELFNELNHQIKNYVPVVKTSNEFMDIFLDSHPLYREHYKRNFTLVMEEGIPTDIWNKIILAYKDANKDYNDREFENYLKENNLNTIIMELPTIFTLQRGLTAEDFDW